MAKKITNPWLNPLHRSYQQIKSKLIEALANMKDKNGKPLVTDFSEGNILVIILSLFAGVVEVLHYYIDNMARETFFSTARKYESLVRHGQLVDYHPKGATAASVDVIITRSSDDSSNSGTIDIPIDTSIRDSNGNVWYNTKATKWYPRTSSVRLSLIQHQKYVLSNIIGTIIPVSSQPTIVFSIPEAGKLYEDGTMTLRIGDTTWKLVDTFAYSSPSDKHFRVDVSQDQRLSIIFGNGKFGAIPESGQVITDCTCYITSGAMGNISAGALDSIPTTISSQVSSASCINPYGATGGSDYEDFDSLKTRIPLSTRTRGVAITKQDFIDLALTVGGVSKVALEYECGRKLNLYIAGIGGGVAAQGLCNSVYKYIQDRSPLTTWLSVMSVGTSEIMLDINVTGKKGFSTTDIYDQVVGALIDKYSYENSDIGRGVRLSDMYALLDGLSMVDYLTINSFYIKPWPKTIYGNTQLTIDTYKLSKAPTNPVDYMVTFDSTEGYNLVSKDGMYRSTGIVGQLFTFDDQYHGLEFSWVILRSTHQPGYKYSVTISKSNTDVENIGYNLAVFTDPSSQLVININETV